LNKKAKKNALLKKLKALEEIFDPPQKLKKKKKKLLTLANLLLHKLEISLETCNNGKNSL